MALILPLELPDRVLVAPPGAKEGENKARPEKLKLKSTSQSNRPARSTELRHTHLFAAVSSPECSHASRASTTGKVEVSR